MGGFLSTPTTPPLQRDRIGHKSSSARLLHPSLHHRMPPRHKLQHARLLNLRPHPSPQRRQMCKTRQQVDLRHPPRRLPHPSRRVQQLPPQLREDSPLDLPRPLLRRQNLRLILLQLRRREPFRVHQRLLSFVVIRNRSTIRLSHFQVIPKDRVEPYLQAPNPRPLPLPLLNRRQRLPPAPPQLAQLIQLRVHPRADHSALRKAHRRLLHNRLHDPLMQVLHRIKSCGKPCGSPCGFLCGKGLALRHGKDRASWQSYRHEWDSHHRVLSTASP